MGYVQMSNELLHFLTLDEDCVSPIDVDGLFAGFNADLEITR